MSDRPEAPSTNNVSDIHEPTLDASSDTPSRKTKSRVKAATVKDGDLGKELMPSIEAIEKHLRDIETTTLASAYAIGCEVKRVQDEGRYGQRGVEFMAAKLGVSYRKLATHAQVVRTWPDQAKFDELTAQARRGARRLEWSHMVELAQAEDAHRDSLLQMALNEGLTIEQLRDAKASLSSAGAAPGTPNKDARRTSARRSHLKVVPTEATRAAPTSPATDAPASIDPDAPQTAHAVETKLRPADALVGVSYALRAAASRLSGLDENELPAQCVSALKKLREATEALEESLEGLTSPAAPASRQ